MRISFNAGIKSRLSIDDLKTVNEGCKQIVENASCYNAMQKVEIISLLQRLYPVQKQLVEEGEDIEMSVYLNIIQLADENIVPHLLKNNFSFCENN